MKQAWVKLEEYSKRLVTSALENGADALVVPSGCQDRIKALGRITTVGDDGDLKPGKDVFFEPLNSPEDEARIGSLLRNGTVVLEPSLGTGEGRGMPARGWEVIPLENLVARGGRLLVPVRTVDELDLAAGILERGVWGVILHARDPEELKTLLRRVKALSEKAPLLTATIDSIQPAGLGDRVCVDTCTLMGEGQGMLVGNSSGFLFLVQAEATQNPYVAPRPFRVNAGPVHAYVRVPGERTRYLSELKAGDPVLVVGHDGGTETATLGRIKIERRPLLLVNATCEGVQGTLLLQNAETIRLTSPDGKARSVVDLVPGNTVMVFREQAGRHFGMRVEETIFER